MPRYRKNEADAQRTENVDTMGGIALPLIGFGIYTFLIVALIFLSEVEIAKKMDVWNWLEDMVQDRKKWLVFTSACTVIFSIQVKYSRSMERFPLEDFGMLIAGLAAFATASIEIEPTYNAEGIALLILASPIILMATLRWHLVFRILVFLFLVALIVLLSGKAIEFIEISLFVISLLIPIALIFGIPLIVAILRGDMKR